MGFILCKLVITLQMLCYHRNVKKNYRSEFNRLQKMTKENYEIYYYNDSHFQSVSPHVHDYYEFYFPVAGKIEMEIDGKHTPLSSRSVVVVPPGTIHRAVTENDERSYCRYVFWISPSYYHRLSGQTEELSYIVRRAESDRKYIYHFSEHEYALVQSKILRLIEEESTSRFGKDVFTSIMISDLIMTLSRFAYEQDHPRRLEREGDTIQAMIGYIDRHLDEDLSLENLGEQFYISKYYAAHEFKERTGMSVHQYIIKKRLERCADEMKTGKSVSRVYADCGFTDYSAFYRAFKKEYNLSPKDYQKVYLRDPMYPDKQRDN